MRRTLRGVAGALVVALTATVGAPPAGAATLKLGGVAVHLRAGTTEVVTVDHTHGFHAIVSLWRRRDGAWVRTLSTPGGRIGYGGLVAGDRRRQGTGTTLLDYNQEQVRHRGAGIFLHVNGRGATAGCVSAPRTFLRALLRRLDPAAVPVIAIGR